MWCGSNRVKSLLPSTTRLHPLRKGVGWQAKALRGQRRHTRHGRQHLGAPHVHHLFPLGEVGRHHLRVVELREARRRGARALRVCEGGWVGEVGREG